MLLRKNLGFFVIQGMGRQRNLLFYLASGFGAKKADKTERGPLNGNWADVRFVWSLACIGRLNMKQRVGGT